MHIYISSASEDLSVARQLAGLLARHPTIASAGDTTIYNPLDDPTLLELDERDTHAARETKLAESNFIVLLLSHAALRSSSVLHDIEQVRRLRDEYAIKFFLTVLLQPLTLDGPLASLPAIVDATSRPLDAVADEIAYYTTWRPRQTGGRITFAPPWPAPQAPPQPVLPPEPGSLPPGAPTGAPELPPDSGHLPYGAPPPLAPPPPTPQGAPAGAPPPPAPISASPAPAPWGAPAAAPPSAPPSAPRREKGGEFATTAAASPSTSTLQFSAYHPNTLAVETWHTLLVYTYIAEALAQIQADASTFTELGSAPIVAQGQSTRAVARGIELTIEPHMEDVTFSPASDSFVWREDWRRSLFRFSGAATLAGREQHGWIDIYAGPMVPIARIDIAFPFHETQTRQLAIRPPRGMIITSNIYDAVFISYSHRDGEAFRQACEEYRRFGITVYTDELLEAGAQYERELSKMIAAAKVFHLLWSRNSAGSFECRKEWLSALQREPSERFIKPWFWKQPLTPPPTEFVQHRISFKYEPLKRSLWRPSTWFQ